MLCTNQVSTWQYAQMDPGMFMFIRLGILTCEHSLLFLRIREASEGIEGSVFHSLVPKVVVDSSARSFGQL